MKKSMLTGFILLFVFSSFQQRPLMTLHALPAINENDLMQSNIPSEKPSFAEACGGVFPAIADATVSSAAPDTPLGAYTTLVVHQGEDFQAYSLLLFDLEGAIPDDAALLEAELELPILETDEPYPYHLQAFNLLEDFGEDDVTWNNQPEMGALYSSVSSANDSGVLYMDLTAMFVDLNQGVISQTVALLSEEEINLSFASMESGEGPRLRITCIPPSDPLPTDPSQRDEDQQAALLRLAAESIITPTVQLGLGGSVRFATFELPIPEEIGGYWLDRAHWFLDSYADLLRLDDPQEDLQLVRRSDDGEHLFFRQRVDGIPLFPGEVVVHLDGEVVTGFNGGYVPDVLVRTDPSISFEAAEQLALSSSGGEVIVGQTQLRLVNLGLLGLDDDRTRLTWETHVAGGGNAGTYYIDALTGKVLVSFPDVIQAFDLELNTGQNDGPHFIYSCWDGATVTADDQWFDEVGPFAAFPDPTPPNPDSEGYLAFNNINTIYNYWKNTFGRDSLDNHGKQIRIYIHVGSTDPSSDYYYPSAHYVQTCQIFEFGEDMPVLDVMSHEYTHGVVMNTVDLAYISQSGAINESLADTFGHFLDNHDWTCGEHTPHGVYRDMSNPPGFGDPDKMSDYFYTCPLDIHGECSCGHPSCPHENSGILSKAAYLMIQGDTFNTWTITGIGQYKAERMFYQLITQVLTTSSQFMDIRNGMLWIADRMHANGELSLNDICQVRNAYAAVELGSGDRDCDGTPDILDSDDDGDGVPDSWDNCPTVVNGNQSDIDQDGEGDACDTDKDGDGEDNLWDNCPLVSNSTQADSNNNGLGDACDDRDVDGYSDVVDTCLAVYNPDQRDTDGDGAGDACDFDDDNDGILDSEPDNCPLRANPMQGDRDGDDVGDICDLCPLVESTSNRDLDGDGLGDECDGDADGDGVANVQDNCWWVPNPDQFDGDGNGVGYACDFEERSGWLAGFPSLGTFKWPWNISLPVCDNCKFNYLPEGFQEKVEVGLPIGFRGRIVNSSGIPVTSGGMAQNNLEMTFFPAPHAAVPTTSSGMPSSATEAYPLQPDQIGYYLQIIPREDIDLGLVHPITITLTTRSEFLYLPLLRKN